MILSCVAFAMASTALAADLDVAGVRLGKSSFDAMLSAIKGQLPEKNNKVFTDDKKRKRGFSASMSFFNESERLKAKTAKTGDRFVALLTEKGVVGAMHRSVTYEILRRTNVSGALIVEVDDYAIPLEHVMSSIKEKYGEPHQVDTFEGVPTLMWLYDEDGKKSSVSPSEYSSNCHLAVIPSGVQRYNSNCTKTLATITVDSARVLVGANKIPSVPYVTGIETQVVAGDLITEDVIAARKADEDSVNKAKMTTKKNTKIDL